MKPSLTVMNVIFDAYLMIIHLIQVSSQAGRNANTVSSGDAAGEEGDVTLTRKSKEFDPKHIFILNISISQANKYQ